MNNIDILFFGGLSYQVVEVFWFFGGGSLFSRHPKWEVRWWSVPKYPCAPKICSAILQTRKERGCVPAPRTEGCHPWYWWTHLTSREGDKSVCQQTSKEAGGWGFSTSYSENRNSDISDSAAWCIIILVRFGAYLITSSNTCEQPMWYSLPRASHCNVDD